MLIYLTIRLFHDFNRIVIRVYIQSIAKVTNIFVIRWQTYPLFLKIRQKFVLFGCKGEKLSLSKFLTKNEKKTKSAEIQTEPVEKK